VKDEPGGDLAERWRDEFPILAETLYMISNSLGAMPRRTEGALAEYARLWATRGVRAWEESWWELAGEVGNRIGSLIGAPPGSVSMHENVTTAAMVALSALEPRPGRDTVLATEGEFPSLIYLLREQARSGPRLELVPTEPDLSLRVERLIDRIDESTLAVVLSHVLFRSSFLVDVEPVVARARERGACVILDVYQSAGVVPVDLSRLGVDHAVGGCLKWLCGGPGTGFLYTRPDRLKALRPRFTGWVAHREPFAFDTGELRPREDALRMMNGTPAVPAYFAARGGLEVVAEVGVDRIRERSSRMTARMLEVVDERGWRSVASRDPARLAGTVAIDVPDGLAASRALKARDVLVDYRPGVGIRFSPHFYNRLEEVDAALAALREVVESGDHGPNRRKRSLVT
jgi:kynureninase